MEHMMNKTTATQKQDNGLSINIQPPHKYKLDQPGLSLSEEEAAGLKLLDGAHRFLVTLGRVCWISALGISIYKFFFGAGIPGETQELLRTASRVGWSAWGINIIARTGVFYPLSGPTSTVATAIARQLPHFRKKRNLAELCAAIEWKVYKDFEDAGIKAMPVDEIEANTLKIKKDAKNSFKFRRNLVRQYRKREYTL